MSRIANERHEERKDVGQAGRDLHELTWGGGGENGLEIMTAVYFRLPAS
jgi:hypothetical protein